MRTFIKICIGLLLLTSCYRPHKYKIGVSQVSQDTWRKKLCRELKTGEYLDDSLQLFFASADDNDEKQIRQIEQFIRQGVDLLIVSPNQYDAISPVIDKAYKKGIPVILYDRKSNTHNYTAFIGGDNEGIGFTTANYISSATGGQTRIVELCGLSKSSPAEERHKGFVEALKKHPGLVLVASIPTDWTFQDAKRSMDSLLQTRQDFDFVFAHSDIMAEGVIQSLKEHRLNKRIRVTGVDALPTAGGGIEMVSKGELEATCAYPTGGDEVLKLAKNILAHRPYQRNTLLQTTLITKDNATQLLMQARELERQTHNLDELHDRVDHYLTEYHYQQAFLLVLVVFLLLLIAAIAMLVRTYFAKAKLYGQLQKQNEELHRQSEEIKQITHERLVFFTNVSHDLRTPLTLIIDPVEQLLEDASVKGRAHHLLQLVYRNASSLLQMVNTILDIRKVQNGKMKLTLTLFNINDEITQLLETFQTTADKHRLSIQLDTTMLTQPEMVADLRLVNRIFYNLMGNALKHTPVEGRIVITLANVADDAVRLTVSNTGTPISPEDQRHLFERFFQSRGSHNGTGIGLALVKTLVELHHGTVGVTSNEKEGTTFKVLLPRRQEGTVVQETTSLPIDNDVTIEQYFDDGNRSDMRVKALTSSSEDATTVLVIDDNNDVRSYECDILSEHYRVIEAANGKEGLEIAMQEVPDLVICDIMMPVMDGLEFCQKLKETPATSHIPVILLTAKTLDEQRAEGYQRGADSYITKPFSRKVLLTRTENLLNGRKQLRHIFAGKREQAEEEKSLSERDRSFVERLREVIQRNLNDSSLSVETIGQEMGLSRVQLYRKVKALTNLSMVELIRSARLERGRKLLRTTDLSVSEVAYEVGFSAPSYFAKCYKDEFGITPNEDKLL